MLDLQRKAMTVLVTLLATVAVLGFGVWGTPRAMPETELSEPSGETASDINFSFTPIAELALEEFNYTDVAVYESEKLKFLISIPFTSKRFIFLYDGEVQAGVKDATKIEIERLDRQKKFVVRTPGVEILSSTIDNSSIEVYDQSFNPLRQHSIEDVAQILSDETQSASNKAVRGGILNRAQERLESQLITYVESVIENSKQADYGVEIERI